MSESPAMDSVCCLDVALAIPDNEAQTALTTLQRLGIGAAALRRAVLYRCDLVGERKDDFVAAFRRIETLYNPNKHVLHVRERSVPEAGEVWISDFGNDSMRATVAGIVVAGRVLPGVQRIERYTGWRLSDAGDRPLSTDVVRAAAETLLCNPAFQRATTA